MSKILISDLEILLLIRKENCFDKGQKITKGNYFILISFKKAAKNPFLISALDLTFNILLFRVQGLTIFLLTFQTLWRENCHCAVPAYYKQCLVPLYSSAQLGHCALELKLFCYCAKWKKSLKRGLLVEQYLVVKVAAQRFMLFGFSMHNWVRLFLKEDSYIYIDNVCFIKIRSKHSSNTLYICFFTKYL